MSNFKVGDRVQVVKYGDKGYGTIKEIRGNEALIHFDYKLLEDTYYYFNELIKFDEWGI